MVSTREKPTHTAAKMTANFFMYSSRNNFNKHLLIIVQMYYILRLTVKAIGNSHESAFYETVLEKVFNND